MRLYDSKSCTPAGGVTSKPWKSCPPLTFIGYSWYLGAQRTPRTMTSSSTPESRQDEAEFPDDEMSSLMPNSRPLSRRSSSVPRSRHRSNGISLSFPKISRSRPPNDARRKTVERHASWSPSKSRVPFALVKNRAVDDTSWRSPCSCNCDKNHQCDMIPRPPSRNMTKHNASFGCEFSPTESTSDDSSSAWRDFSLDGNENPFQAGVTPTSPNYEFVPIEKAPEQRAMMMMMVKPTPVQRTKSSHALFPSQESRESARFYEYDGNNMSAFSTPNRSASQSRGRHPVSRLTLSSTPRLAPSPRDVEPISGSAVRRVKGQAEAKMLVDLAKYSCMLKSRVPLVLVKKIMEREGVSSSIIELAMAAHNSGIEFGDGDVV